MAIKFIGVDREVLVKIQNGKARGTDISKFSDIQSKAFIRLCGAGLAEDINGFAYVTGKGLKKLRKI